MQSRLNAAQLLLALVVMAGCGGEIVVDEERLKSMAGGELGERVPVSGTVSIGGAPTAMVAIYAYNAESGRKPFAEVKTGADGSYCWTTHAPCDGLPPGEYKLAFAHIPDDGKGKNAGEDKLKGKYRNPAKSGITLTVKSGEPQTEANYNLE